ncbi:MAG: hypothetical protein HKN70_06550 [Gammaproteobacteria bacterium]|nr:hypothetical protein [Gammaproteobacteria bacterium]
MRQTNSLIFILLLAATTGCVSTTVVNVSSEPAIKAAEVLPEEQLLDIGILMFDPGVPEDQKKAEKKFINARVRNAESAYIPYELRRTLEATENWGAVRILPRPTEAVDLLIGGDIIKSDGEVLVVDVRASDASGRLWLEKRYSDSASGMSYEEEVAGNEEPFQDLYNNISNDLLALRRELDAGELERIRTISKLKFAAEISPYAYSEYYEVDDNGYVDIKRLPAEDDPMLGRVGKIRDREYAFIDILDEHYEGFHNKMSQPYEDWRRYSYEETIALRELVRTSRLTMAAGVLVAVGGAVMQNKADNAAEYYGGRAAMVVGGNLVKGGYDLSKQTNLHAVALKELADSFVQEVQPMLVEVEGRTIELTGTADQQYDKWRRLLREIYESETGLTVQDSEMPQPQLRHLEDL